MSAHTKFPEIFGALAAPFDPKEVKQRIGGGNKQLSYITARSAMNRLDDVLGPESWSDDYFEVCDVLFCRITITLPDGTTVSKSDAGGFKEMKEGGKTDQENTDKTGPSDAFKRAAAKFGVARYLYKDGIPRYETTPIPAPVVANNNSGFGRGSYASPEQTDVFRQALSAWVDQKNAAWLDRWMVNGEVPEDIKDLLSTWQSNGHLIKHCVESGLLDPAIVPGDVKPAQKDKYVAIVYHRSKHDRKALGLEMERYAAEQASRATEAYYRKHPELRPEEDELAGMDDDQGDAYEEALRN